MTIYEWVHPRTRKRMWRYAWHDGKGWRYVTRKTQDEAVEAAKEQLEDRKAGEVAIEVAPERKRFLEAVHRETGVEHEAAVLRFIASLKTSSELGAAVARFLAWKVAEKGGSTPHLVQMKRDLEALAKAFPGRLVSEVGLDELAAWWKARCTQEKGGKAIEAGRHRLQGVRRTLVSFWRWARKDGLAGNEPVTVAERLPSLKLGAGSLSVFTPAEMGKMLQWLLTAEEKWREWGPWVVLGGFAGIRPEELAPKKGTKAGLCWENIDWCFNVIRMPAEVSKVRRPRVIPLLPAARHWLERFGVREDFRGALYQDLNAAEAGVTKKLGEVLKRADGWPKDALRHSYGTYRNSVIRSLPQVAEEMGTSEAMLHKHYHNPRAKEEGEAWFAVPMGSEKATLNGAMKADARKRKAC